MHKCLWNSALWTHLGPTILQVVMNSKDSSMTGRLSKCHLFLHHSSPSYIVAVLPKGSQQFVKSYFNSFSYSLCEDPRCRSILLFPQTFTSEMIPSLLLMLSSLKSLGENSCQIQDKRHWLGHIPVFRLDWNLASEKTLSYVSFLWVKYLYLKSMVLPIARMTKKCLKDIIFQKTR